MLNSDLSPTAPQGGWLPPTDKTRVVSTRRRVPTNWVSGRTLQSSIESVVANSFVPSDFLVDGQVSGLGTVHPLLTLSFISTWILLTWRSTCSFWLSHFDYEYDRAAALRRSRRHQHASVLCSIPDSVYQCPLCGRQCYSRIGLLSHSKTHIQLWIGRRRHP